MYVRPSGPPDRACGSLYTAALLQYLIHIGCIGFAFRTNPGLIGVDMGGGGGVYTHALGVVYGCAVAISHTHWVCTAHSFRTHTTSLDTQVSTRGSQCMLYQQFSVNQILSSL